MTQISWQPQPGGQIAAATCPLREVCFVGNRKGGKSDSLVMEHIGGVGKGFGMAHRGLVLRRTYSGLEDIFKKAVDIVTRTWSEAKIINSFPHKIVWPTGEELIFSFAKEEKDYEKFHGWMVSTLLWDELTQHPTPAVYLKMMSLLVAVNPKLPLKVRSNCNPGGPGHSWVKKRFGLPILGVENGNRIGPIIREPGEHARVAIEIPRSDNKVLFPNDLAMQDYEASLRADARNPAQLRAWLYGDWNIVAGGAVDDLWDPEKHVVPTPPLRQFVMNGWTVYRAMDWGDSKPAAIYWVAYPGDGRPFVYQGTTFGRDPRDRYLVREIYTWNGRPNEGRYPTGREIAREILAVEESEGVVDQIDIGPADHDIFTLKGGNSVEKDMKEEGVFWRKADKGKGSRIRGLQSLRARLEAVVTDDPQKQDDPKLFVCDQCVHWIRTVPVLPRDEKDPDDVDSAAEDHCYDVTRMALAHDAGTLSRIHLDGR